MKSKIQRGFTLIELMIVVAIIGILAAVAIPQFLKYLAKSKKGEAELNLNAIEKANTAYYGEENSFVVSAATTSPATACCAQAGRKCAVVAADWSGATDPWLKLQGFAMTKAFNFQYTYVGAAAAASTTFTATAVGDLDCDGTSITYTLTGAANNASEAPVFTFTKPTTND